MDKYASMWKADTPIERQADARDLWDDLTGINHSKQDTTTRLHELFPAARTHNKEASKSSVIRDRLLGAGLAGGAIVGGGYQYNQSKKNSKGLTKRQQARIVRDAAYQKSLETGGSAKSKAGVKLDRMREQYENYLDANPGMATAMGATLGGGAALLGGTQAIKRLASRVK